MQGANCTYIKSQMEAIEVLTNEIVSALEREAREEITERNLHKLWQITRLSGKER